MMTTVSSNRDQLVALIDELTDEQVDALTPFVTDLAEAVKTEDGIELDRDEFRESLNLKRFIPEPTITPLPGVELPGSDVNWDARKKAGKYNWANSDLTEARFPLTLSAGPQDLALAHLGVDVTSEEVEAWTTQHGYEVVTIDDLFAVGSHSEYKELQRKFPIIALGSSAVVRGDRFVPCLHRNGSKRNLHLYCWDIDWNTDYRFLLRMVSKPLVTLPLGT